jgi:uncharacterized membrane protein YbhN (UPF0104 family)
MRAWIAANRQLLLRGLGTLLAVGLIFVLIHEEGWDEFLTAFRSLSLPRLLLALLFILISRIFVVTRWYVLLRSGGVPIPYSRTLALTFTGLFSSNFLPTTIGGDVVRLAGVMQMGYDRAVSLASIAADRLIGMAGMVFALPFGLPQALSVIGGAAQSAVFPAMLGRFRDFVRRTLQSFSTWLNQPLALLGALGCSWGHMLCTFAALYILIEGLGAHVDFWLLGGLWSVTYFVTLIPISINGYGVQELSLTYLLSSAAGLGATLSLTVAIMIRVLYMLASLPGAVTMPGLLAAMGRGAPVETK